MCMMCEEDALYYAFLEWKAQKDQEEAAKQAATGAAPPDTSEFAAPGRTVSGPEAPKSSFTCD